MDQKILEKIIKNLQAKVQCPICGHRFEKNQIKFKGFLKNIYLFEFGCPVCSTLLYAKVLVNQVTNRRNQSLISKKFVVPRKKITANDIIQLHQILERSEADLEDLLN